MAYLWNDQSNQRPCNNVGMSYRASRYLVAINWVLLGLVLGSAAIFGLAVVGIIALITGF